MNWEVKGKICWSVFGQGIGRETDSKLSILGRKK